jgi:hypothetical protein
MLSISWILIILGIIITTVVIIYVTTNKSNDSSNDTTNTKCLSGYFIENNTCKKCPINTYSIEGINRCIPCLAGYASTEGSSICKKICSDGSIYNTTNKTCEQCPSNTYQELNECLPCEDKCMTSNKGSTSCNIKICDPIITPSCPINSTNISNGNPQIPNYTGCYCNIGYEFDTTTSTCVKICDNGTVYNTIDKTCDRCDAGSYLPEGTTTCINCPIGMFSSSGATLCEDCPAGRYLQDGSTACLNCPAGQFSSSSGATTCVNCPAGQYSSSGATVCLNCPAGQYSSSSGATTCINCPVGQYSSSGATLCVTCPANSTTNVTPVRITANCYCNPNYGLRNGACTQCPYNSSPLYTGESTEVPYCNCRTGYGWDGRISGSCVGCPTGTSPANGTQQGYEAIPGCYCNNPGESWNGTNCVICLGGSYIDGTGVDANPGCKCLSGFGWDGTNCIICSGGSSNNATGPTANVSGCNCAYGDIWNGTTCTTPGYTDPVPVYVSGTSLYGTVDLNNVGRILYANPFKTYSNTVSLTSNTPSNIEGQTLTSGGLLNPSSVSIMFPTYDVYINNILLYYNTPTNNTIQKSIHYSGSTAGSGINANIYFTDNSINKLYRIILDMRGSNFQNIYIDLTNDRFTNYYYFKIINIYHNKVYLDII